ncbi:MAG: ABC transporter permease [Oscillospiraceae bacterium]|nr:ABC transporter permease [Oscillospiraceae bacterium]
MFNTILGLLKTAYELGAIYAVMALGVFISYRTLDTPDLTVDSSFTLGAACSAVFALAGHPVIGLLVGFLAGGAAGAITALLNTKLKIAALLSGILMMLGLYSINLRIMGQPNISLARAANIFSIADKIPNGKIILSTGLLIIVVVALWLFLNTKLGLALRATGDNEHMVRASGVDTDTMKLIGMAVANALVALSGSVMAQQQKFTDLNMGVGMVVIGLASVIIGEVIFGTRPILRRLIAVALGSVVYRAVIGAAMQLGLPASDMKLITAVIVIVALALPNLFSGAGSLKKLSKGPVK